MDLILSDVACARGGVRVLEGINLRLSGGQALVLRGPNGIGKTTLLRTLAGLQPPTAGRIVAPPEAIAYAAHADGLKATLTRGGEPAVLGRDPRQEGRGRGAWCDGSGRGCATARRATCRRGRSGGWGLRGSWSPAGRSGCWTSRPSRSMPASVALFADVVRAHLAAGGAALIATPYRPRACRGDGLDLGPFRARGGPARRGAFDEAFG